jgi:hypothetical protein
MEGRAMEGDGKRTIERREKFQKMVREAFPDKPIDIIRKEEYRGDGPNELRIRIREPQGPPRRILLILTEEFMTDVGFPFVGRVKEAIKIAKQKLTIPQKGFLGRIILTTTEIEWKPEEKEKR